jgi:hypothetical protein
MGPRIKAPKARVSPASASARIGVLKLVHKNMSVPRTECAAHGRVIPEQGARAIQ